MSLKSNAEEESRNIQTQLDELRKNKTSLQKKVRATLYFSLTKEQMK